MQKNSNVSRVNQTTELDLVETGDINNTFLAIEVTKDENGKKVGGAYVNQNERIMYVTEFIDNEHLSGLESYVLQMNNSSNESKFEVLLNVPSYNKDPLLHDKVQDMFGQQDIQFTIIENDRKIFDQNKKNLSNVLSKLLKEEVNYKIQETEMILALGCLSACVNKMNLANRGINKFDLEKYTLGQYLRLDIAALKSLNIFPQNNELVAGSAGSIYGLLNQCKTSIGARLLKKWLKQPTTEQTQIEQRLAIVEYLVQNEHVRQDLQSTYLRTFPDLEKLYTKFYRVQAQLRHSAGLIDCVKVYNMIHTLEALCQFLDESVIDEQHTLRTTILEPLQNTLEEFKQLKSMLEECIDISRAKQNDYIINPNFNTELGKLSEDSDRVKAQMLQLRKHVEQDLQTKKKVDLVESQMHSFIFECNKKEGDSGMRQSKNQYKVLGMKMNVMNFTCNELKELVKKYDELNDEYSGKQDQLVIKVLEIVSTYHPLLEKISVIIAQIDVLASFALVSCQYNYVKPKICQEDDKLVLIDSRHPLIEVADPQQCISNGCQMIKGESNLQIITGPNMGGKSTYIRQVATCILMMHIGCFVPATQAEIPVMDCIIARCGASDHQLRGISTFMSEMLEASCMLKTASERSFIIMDELGRGTSTNEGFGLAWAIAEHIATDIKAFCLFATHFHEMTAMPKELPNVKNLYVKALAEDEKLTMLYKVEEGVIDRSYGIHVAQMLKFPQEVLDEAKKLADQLENFHEEGVPDDQKVLQ